MGGIYASLGKSGLEVSMKKTSKKDGMKSKVKIGNKKQFALHSAIKTGFPIMAIRDLDSTEDPRRLAKKIPVTSNVVGITALDAKIFEVETETSFYQVSFL